MTPLAAPASAGMPLATVRTMLRGVIDYAGLFPPASLGMRAAVAEYTEHKSAEHAWALGRFVVPAGRLDEFESEAADVLPRDAARSWALSGLLGSDLEEDIERIERFNERYRDARDGAVIVDTVELKVQSARDVSHAGDLLDRRFDTYMEVPAAGDPGDIIAAVAGTKAKAKIRMGGVTPDAFPSSSQVTGFIACCVANGVAFKATAGLHHPWRNEYRLTHAADAPCGTMFGFLNVLLAAVAIRDGWPVADAAALLEEREPGAVRFHPDRVCWRNHELSLDGIARARDLITAIGSCSFLEPIGGLQASALL